MALLTFNRYRDLPEAERIRRIGEFRGALKLASVVIGEAGGPELAFRVFPNGRHGKNESKNDADYQE